MKSNFEKHLLGIFKILKNKFDYINQSIGHNLTTGEENETEIRKLLIDFLPSNYGISSGLIIDTKGNQSKQVDIIIYDKNTPNYTLSSDSKLFLVDQVIATIEIKTTFTTGESGSLNQSLENVKSIKNLKPSAQKWIEDVLKIQADGHTAWAVETYDKPRPPICIIFFYKLPERKTAIDIENYYNSLKDGLSKYKFEEQPNIIFSLDHAGFFIHKDVAQSKEGKFYISLLSVGGNYNRQVSIDEIDHNYKAIVNYGDSTFAENSFIDAKFITNQDGSIKIVAIESENLVLEPLVYRTGKIKDKVYFIDPYRGFMNFIYTIEFYLRYKRTNKNTYITDYFPVGYFNISNYNNGLDLTD